jgi:hypothetical protein
MKLIVSVEEITIGARVSAEVAFDSDQDANPSKSEVETIYAMGNFLCTAARCWLEANHMTIAQRQAMIESMTAKPLIH